MSARKSIDRTLLVIVGMLVVGGFLVFSSASLGLLAREGASFSSVATSQILFGMIGGTIALFITANIHYRVWRKYAFYILLGALALTALVFLPEPWSMTHGGATRWVRVGPLSFQPSEFLKLAFVLYLATWLSGMGKHVNTFARGILPILIVTGIVGGLLLAQPDTDTLAIMVGAALAMFLTAGGRWRYVFFAVLIGVVLIGALALARPYVKDRLLTFWNPSLDPQGSSYQVNQSLIALGSGGAWGRGFGQSVQKFGYLPEPIGDSVFAVLGEEFGFVGTVAVIVLFLFFAMRGYKIAADAPDLFGMLVVVGLVTTITLQAFLNIAAMLALAPLSGLPLPFVSHGGTALFATLAAVGIILNISRYRSKRPARKG